MRVKYSAPRLMIATAPPESIPFSGVATGFIAPNPFFAVLSTPAPFRYGIGMTAELAFKGSDKRGLLSSSHEGRFESSDMLLVTEIGRSNMVKKSVPFNRKFCWMVIYNK